MCACHLWCCAARHMYMYTRMHAHQAKAEAEGLRARLDVKGDERALQAAQEELANARAEVRDLTDAVGAWLVVSFCCVVLPGGRCVAFGVS